MLAENCFSYKSPWRIGEKFFGVRRLGAAFVLDGLPSSYEKRAYQNDTAETFTDGARPWAPT